MMTPLSEDSLTARIAHFKQASRVRGDEQLPSGYPTALVAGYARYADRPRAEQVAHARADALAGLPVYLFPDERLVGMMYMLGRESPVVDPLNYQAQVSVATADRLPANAELVDLKLQMDNVIPGHIAWRWDWLLARGITGLIADTRAALATSADARAADFYQGVLTVLESVLRWNDRHIAALEEALAGAPPEERTRLEDNLATCRRVPAEAARTFREAVQSFYFQYLAVMRENPHGGNGPGRLDYYLWPYLERDLAAGRTTLAEARELIDELFVRIHERIQGRDTWVETIVVGGCHPDGTSAVSPLSYLMVESIMALDQTHPSVYLRVPEDAPAEFIDLATRYLLQGNNRAQILSDREIVRAMTGYGMPVEDARMYACGGCMEIMPHGMNSDLLFAATHNVPKVVELALTGGECLQTGKRLAHVALPALTDCATFEELYRVFAEELRRELLNIFHRLDLGSEMMAAYRPNFLISSMVMDCLARGREMQDGGARYHDYGVTPLGIPNAGDALFAVKRAVFDEGLCTAEELLAAMRADFAGHEELRRRLRALPKFGQQQAEADAMTDRVLTTVCDIYAGYRNRWQGRVKPIIFTFVWAPEAGAVLGATADGNHAGTAIAHGLTPQSAAMTDGLTAAIGSHAGLSLHHVAGGASSMWDLDPRWATPDTTRALLTGFLTLGGQIFQGNATDVAELLQAREHPEHYPNLIVRVGGFSARFVALSPAVQDDIINRYRHQG
jgi:pyruvate-formate lyase